MLTTSGDFEKAARRYEELLRLTPESPGVHLNFARVLFRIGRRDEAITHLQKALELKPDFTEAKKELETLTRSSEK